MNDLAKTVEGPCADCGTHELLFPMLVRATEDHALGYVFLCADCSRDWDED